MEGVATVQVGGTSTTVFYIECSRPNATKDGLTWSRENGQINPMFVQDNQITNALRLRMAGAQHSDLDVYVCTDTITGDMVQLKVTNGENHKTMLYSNIKSVW